MMKEFAACEHIFLGRRVIAELERVAAPLDVHRSIVNEHVYMCGRTGSGKTALGILPLLYQLARPWKSAKRDAAGKIKKENGQPVFQREKRPPIVILDMKGDAALFNSARKIAKDNDYPFRFFTLDSGKSSCVFDPFRELASRSPVEMCEVFIRALNLFHGEEYGASYFSRQHRHYLREALKKAREKKTPIKSFVELYDYLERLYAGSKKEDASELMMVVAAMSEYPQLVAGDRTSSDFLIDMKAVIEQRQMVYFWLPADVAAMSVREVGKLAIYALNVAARSIAEAGQRTQTYVFVDEFQEIAGENLKQILNQSRSRGLSYILTNQQYPDLILKDADLGPVALNNPRLVLAFTPSGDAELSKWVERRSGLTTKPLISRTEGRSINPFGQVSESESTTTRTVEVSRVDAEVCRKVTNDPQGALAVITQDDGLSDTGGIPTWVRMNFTMEPSEHERRSSFAKMPWPTAPELKPVATPSTSANVSSETKEKFNDEMEAMLKGKPRLRPDPTDPKRTPKRKRP